MISCGRDTGICRDCLTWHEEYSDRCTQCGSPRIVFHEELKTLSIGHVDCDAFYASVEKRDNPELVNKPVIIGGGRRSVVSTACYIARIHGVHSAQPMFKALKACPEAVVIRPNMEKYVKVSQEIREIMLSLTPLVEPLSIDEAFLDFSGTYRLHGMPASEMLIRLAEQIYKNLHLTVSIGLSYCKFLAKIASDLNKPRGFSVIGEKEALFFLRNQPVSIVWGVGKVTQKMLAKDGITNLSTIQDMEESDLVKQYGAIGQRLYRFSRGVDDRSVSTSSGTKSVNSETTFPNDLSTRDALVPVLRKLSQKVSRQLKGKNLAGHTVTLKLKTSAFETRTRSRQNADATQLEDRIFRMAVKLLTPEIDGTRYRLVGVGVSNLVPDDNADPGELFNPDALRRADVERAIDSIRGKFGEKALTFGINFKA